jgi:hypothetical protein
MRYYNFWHNQTYNPATYIQDSIDFRVVFGTVLSFENPDLPAQRFRSSFHTFTAGGFLFSRKPLRGKIEVFCFIDLDQH